MTIFIICCVLLLAFGTLILCIGLTRAARGLLIGIIRLGRLPAVLLIKLYCRGGAT